MFEFKDERNWVNDILGLRIIYSLSFNDNIRKMSSKYWKKFVKNTVLREAFLQLQIECASDKTTCHITLPVLQNKLLFPGAFSWFIKAGI